MKILYFAMFRERLNRSEDELDLPPGIETIADLIGHLRSSDPVADDLFSKPEIVRAAVDARLVPLTASVLGAKVVALLPPMTGG